jgi:hypothetical protein
LRADFIERYFCANLIFRWRAKEMLQRGLTSSAFSSPRGAHRPASRTMARTSSL